MNYLEQEILQLLIKKQQPNYEFKNQFYANSFWNYFNEINKKLNPNKELSITEYEFKLLISEIYKILILRIPEEQINHVLTQYVTLLCADFCDTKREYNITVQHCLDYLYYLATYSDKKVTKKFYNDLPYIQDKLYKTFNIEEKIKNKIKRKIVINYFKGVGKLQNN